MVLNYMWDWKFSEEVILMPKICSTSLYAWGVISTFEDEICSIGRNLKYWVWGGAWIISTKFPGTDLAPIIYVDIES